jgi:hypothetical protein
MVESGYVDDFNVLSDIRKNEEDILIKNMLSSEQKNSRKNSRKYTNYIYPILFPFPSLFEITHLLNKAIQFYFLFFGVFLFFSLSLINLTSNSSVSRKRLYFLDAQNYLTKFHNLYNYLLICIIMEMPLEVYTSVI